MKVVNCLSLGEMCEAALDGEPVFILRAKDKIATSVLSYYLEMTKKEGGKNVGRTDAALVRMMEWRTDNPDKVKIPD